MQTKKYPFHIYLSAKIVSPLIRIFDALKDIGDLIVRVWVAKIFFVSGMSKLVDWNSTLVLFKYDYHVPFMSPVIAAYMGTTAEFVLPALLVLGLGGRLTLFAFFIYNLICVVSFSFLWTPSGISGLDDHVNWGLLLMLMLFYGYGRLSIDYWLRQRYGHLLMLGSSNKSFWFSK